MRTAQERLDSILAIRRVAREYGSVQECIVQNFRAKDGHGDAQHAGPR